MDTETLNEAGHVIITVVISLVLIAIITGSAFLGKARNMIDRAVPKQEEYAYQNDGAFMDYLIKEGNN